MENNEFWQDLDRLIESVSKQERIVLGTDLNGYVGNIGNAAVMEKYGAGTSNKEGFCEKDGSGGCQHLLQEENTG